MKTGLLKKCILAVLAAAAAVCAALAFIPFGKTARAEGITLESTGDSFNLSGAEYGAQDKFVYSATATFEKGNAAGLVFGAEEGGHYWVFNVDRSANAVKLMYFSEGNETKVLKEDYFIGNDKMTEGERAMVNPDVAKIEKVNIKIIITPEAGAVYGEFYADNIRRFAFDEAGADVKTDLNSLADGLTYAGGATGFNCFNAKVVFGDVYSAASDYSYYTETYRQQYHFSQYAHWNNDPNGLVYYNGYYHIYYQHNPYGNVWGDMYWGHARSKDLVHWEHLPIALFPDKESDFAGRGDGYMWSGSAMVYHSGMSADIDSQNWFANGGGDGLLGFYTRDGKRQDQVIMSSDDGGITWTKRKLIEQEININTGKKESNRDPKVFPVLKSGSSVTLWGMALTGMETNDVWFLKSSNLLDWTYAGGFKSYRPECPDVVTLNADDGRELTVMTFTARQYLVGTIGYDSSSGHITFTDTNGNDVSALEMEEIPFKTMDFGPDSYATQSFYIDDNNSEYFGKTVGLSWFSGVPGNALSVDSGALAAARKTWNGGGMTIPVEYGLVNDGGEYILTQTPVVKTANGFKNIKTQILSVTDAAVTANGENILSGISARTFELEAEIQNPDGAAVCFRINSDGNEYTEIGWNPTDGYYVDRTRSGAGGMTLGNYRNKFSSHKGEAGTQSFYILSDNGSVEVYCGDFKVPFYVLTFASPYALGAEFISDGSVTASVNINKIASAWRDSSVTGSVINTDFDELLLDTKLTTSQEISAYAPYGGEINWRVKDGSAVAVEKTGRGAKITAVSAGSANIEVSCGDAVKVIPVTVTSGTPDSDLSFTAQGVRSGNWYMTSDGIMGVQPSGDGFIFTEESAGDFTLSAQFTLSGAAAALVFRADVDLNNYLVLTYDKNAPIVKLWSPSVVGNIGEKAVAKTDEILLKVIVEGNNITVYFNGEHAFDCIVPEGIPAEGRFGLNVCAGTAVFKSVALLQSEYAYSGGNLTVAGETDQRVIAIYNTTLKNTPVNSAFYTVEGRRVTISGDYFSTLAAAGSYDFNIKGERSSFTFTVAVAEIPAPELLSVNIEKGCNAVIFIGSAAVDGLTLNGVALSETDYSVKDGVLTVNADKLTAGENVLSFGGKTVTVNVSAQPSANLKAENKHGNTALIISLSVIGGVLILGGAAAVAAVIIVRERKAALKGERNGDDD